MRSVIDKKVYLFIFTKESIPFLSAFARASISSFVLYSERLTRSEQSELCASSPKAISEELG